MDTGHYHPSETIIDKITSVRPFVSCIMLHLSRGIRWDSDHTLICNDELIAIMQELNRADYIGRDIFIGLDYFDASINRVASWIIGLRAAGKALLTALLEPAGLLFGAEANGDYTSRLALMEEIKNLPVGAVWDMACLRKEAGVREDWLARLKKIRVGCSAETVRGQTRGSTVLSSEKVASASRICRRGTILCARMHRQKYKSRRLDGQETR